MYDVFSEVFRVLPLCHVLNKKVIVIHGGLPRQGDVTLSEITAIDRKREIPEDGVMTDLLWADPGETPGISMSKRCGRANLTKSCNAAAYLDHKVLGDYMYVLRRCLFFSSPCLVD
jgi:diadenosine tetraphosphatase ApaH/serine/threonine PP2A family protein phosphatase